MTVRVIAKPAKPLRNFILFWFCSSVIKIQVSSFFRRLPWVYCTMLIQISDWRIFFAGLVTKKNQCYKHVSIVFCKFIPESQSSRSIKRSKVLKKNTLPQKMMMLFKTMLGWAVCNAFHVRYPWYRRQGTPQAHTNYPFIIFISSLCCTSVRVNWSASYDASHCTIQLLPYAITPVRIGWQVVWCVFQFPCKSAYLSNLRF